MSHINGSAASFAALLMSAGLESVDRSPDKDNQINALRNAAGRARMKANNAAVAAAAAEARQDPNQTDMFTNKGKDA